MNRFWKTVSIVTLLSVGAIFTGWAVTNRSPGKGAEVVSKTSRPTAKVGTAIGDTAPDFQLASIGGAPISLADLRGQPAVLVFWTAWCPVCKEEAPHFNKLAAQYETLGVRVLGINIQDSLARTESGIKDFGIRYAVVRDADAGVARLYKVTGTPTILFLDRQGIVRYFGNELPADYPARLDALIQEGSAAQ
ncbi:MAG: TlpA family protein disulfide reductase [Pyrinomonadaceae bacterium]|nr:TlpA family protein disulfide reductase [Pyrinomonadaceae bacterium]MDQ3172231.1 TlpA family protein disulfide reductase [Acidobacteriota bacterium]